MKLRRKIEIELADSPPEPRPVRAFEQLAVYQRMNPRTSARDVAESPCAICGGPTGTSAPLWGVWRRHPGCVPLAAWEPSRVEAACKALAIPLDGDADLVRHRVPTFDTVHAEPTWSADEPMRLKLPWRHVDRVGLAAAVAELPRLRVEAGRVPSTCTTGPCGWCGVAEAVGWTFYGHAWSDGSQASLCGPCGRVYVASGEPPAQQLELQREGIAMAITGTPWALGLPVPSGLLAYVEADPETGTGGAWSHLPADAVASFRWVCWARFPAYAPAERRAEALARARAADEAKAARQAAREAEKARAEDIYGFGGRDE